MGYMGILLCYTPSHVQFYLPTGDYRALGMKNHPNSSAWDVKPNWFVTWTLGRLPRKKPGLCFGGVVWKGT